MIKHSNYCISGCPIGKAESDKILNESESAFDAAFDMRCFVDKCILTCPYKKLREKFDEEEK